MKTAAMLLVPAVTLAIACERTAEHADSAQVESTHAATQEATAHAGVPDSAHDALPLRPIMQQLSNEMAKLTAALWTEDYAAMSASASAIANHAHISAEELSRVSGILGSDMTAFETIDSEVHETAMRLHEVVQTRDADAIVLALGTVQRGCVTCHARFRERLRTIPQ